jgi:FAD/FMN-containing dehydrogenase
LPLSVRGGGHHWAGRALCAGIVIDLSGMNGVSVDADHRSAIISGGARAADVAAVTDPLHVAAVTGTCSTVGMAGLTLGGGYGPLIGCFGLALDNLLALRSCSLMDAPLSPAATMKRSCSGHCAVAAETSAS